MTPNDARDWLATRFGDRAIDRLGVYVALLIAGTERQNLIAPSTVPDVWSRHIADSAQLLDLAPDAWTSWIDIGSGAGLPGLVVAILDERPVTLVEPRKLRVEFLRACADAMNLENVEIRQTKIERVALTQPAPVMSARAVAALPALFSATRHISDERTVFLLPKGASAQSEVADVRRSWHGMFHVKRSVIDSTSGIVVATGVLPR